MTAGDSAVPTRTPPQGGVFLATFPGMEKIALRIAARGKARTKKLLGTLVLLLAAGMAPAETVDGYVTAIVSGDTLQVDVPGRGQWRVRLAWVAAPARLQEFGEAARSGLGALAAGRAVRLENPRAAGGEWMARVWAAPPLTRCGKADCPPTLDLGLAQIERGMAWHDPRESGPPPAMADYRQAEFAAKIRRLGLWAGKNPLPPWEWRGSR